jgi:hypothetical protein
MSESCEWQHGILDFGQILVKFRFLASMDVASTVVWIRSKLVLHFTVEVVGTCAVNLDMETLCTAHNFEDWQKPRFKLCSLYFRVCMVENLRKLNCLDCGY